MSGRCCRDTSETRCHGSDKGDAYAKSDEPSIEWWEDQDCIPRLLITDLPSGVITEHAPGSSDRIRNPCFKLCCLFDGNFSPVSSVIPGHRQVAHYARARLLVQTIKHPTEPPSAETMCAILRPCQRLSS